MIARRNCSRASTLPRPQQTPTPLPPPPPPPPPAARRNNFRDRIPLTCREKCPSPQVFSTARSMFSKNDVEPDSLRAALEGFAVSKQRADTAGQVKMGEKKKPIEPAGARLEGLSRQTATR